MFLYMLKDLEFFIYNIVGKVFREVSKVKSCRVVCIIVRFVLVSLVDRKGISLLFCKIYIIFFI